MLAFAPLGLSLSNSEPSLKMNSHFSLSPSLLPKYVNGTQLQSEVGWARSQGEGDIECSEHRASLPADWSDGLSPDIPPSCGAVSFVQREYQGMTVSLHSTSQNDLTSFWRETYFYRHVFQTFPFPKNLRYGEKFCETKRDLVCSVLYLKCFWKGVSQEAPCDYLVYPNRTRSCHLNERVPSWAATKQS